jgi:hypothetical protein
MATRRYYKTGSIATSTGEDVGIPNNVKVNQLIMRGTAANYVIYLEPTATAGAMKQTDADFNSGINYVHNIQGMVDLQLHNSSGSDTVTYYITGEEYI